MAKQPPGRIKASLIHFLISFLIVGSFLLLVFLVWYPDPYFKVHGKWSVVRMLIIVDLIVGPGITLIVFKYGKPGLKFDLTMIAAVQLIALTYGISVIYEGRPSYLVYTVDRFEVVSATEIDTSKIAYEELRQPPTAGLALAVAQFPKDPKIREQIMFDALLRGLPDIDRRPELYHPYKGDRESMSKSASDIRKLAEAPGNDPLEIDEFLGKHGGEIEDYAFYPLVGRYGKMLMAVDRATMMPVGGVDLDPWPKAGQLKPNSS
ncbi:MAG: hypothetical protein OEQ39_06740 [Gammaproteobacteria bacterium]|nr:hypothetical protein [Gammaproteobacteria bacterium]MDH3464787.1 hypothetical protein [Gammaproteobacteria bacterium]